MKGDAHNITGSFNVENDGEWLSKYKVYLILSGFRTAAILQGVYARGIKGNASSTRAKMMGETAKIYVQSAATLVSEKDCILFPLKGVFRVLLSCLLTLFSKIIKSFLCL